jgi:hypothetical protein
MMAYVLYVKSMIATGVNGISSKRQEEIHLLKIIEKIKKRKRIYDCVIPISGGKDSVYALYYAKKNLGLNCLAVTFDNGFLSQSAKLNIQNACQKLKTDHIYYGLNTPFLMQLYRYLFLKSGFFCPICMRGIQVTVSRIQKNFDIPIALRGTCRRTEEHISNEFFISGDLGFIESVLEEESSLYNEAEWFLSPIGIFKGPYQIKLPDYIDWDYDVIFKKITEELNWTAPSLEAEHSDCYASDIVHYIRWRKFPSLIPERLRYSKLATAGILSKEVAQTKVAARHFAGNEPADMKRFLSALNITLDEFNDVVSNPLVHMKYFKRNRSRVKRRLLSLKRKFF